MVVWGSRSLLGISRCDRSREGVAAIALGKVSPRSLLGVCSRDRSFFGNGAIGGNDFDRS